MTERIAYYPRVSTNEQSTASQLPDLERHAAGQTGEVVWFRDAFTGRTMERPGLTELLNELRADKLTKIVVWRLDRLGRTAKGLLELLEEIQSRNVGFVSLQEGIDITTPAGRLMFSILASFAAYETEVRSERCRAGIAAAKAKGKRWGGSKPGIPKKLTPAMVKKVRELKDKGVGVTAISAVLKLSRPTVYSALNGHRPEREQDGTTGQPPDPQSV